MVERILARWGAISEDAYPRCIFDGNACTGDSTITFTNIEQVDGNFLATPRGALYRGTTYFCCDDEIQCDGRSFSLLRKVDHEESPPSSQAS